MSRPRLLLLCALLLPGTAMAQCPVFTLERDGRDIVVRKELLGEGEVAVYARDPARGVIDVILPVGPGRSASFLRLTDADRIVVRYTQGELHAQVRRAAGDPVELPARRLADLRREQIRVSVTVADSVRRSFLIADYDTALVDPVGPATNMFAGRLPDALAHEGIVVQTDTWPSAPASPACGVAALVRDRWLFAKARRPDGGEGWFVVDLGAAETMVARTFVPDGQSVTPLSTTEHSAAGTRQLPYAPAGATGTVQGVVGSTEFDSLSFGGLRFAAAHVTVLESLPDVFGRPVVGILGLDLLRGCERLQLQFAPDGQHATLALTTTPATGRLLAETPYSLVASHLMVRGLMEGRDTRWILDTGSPGMVLDSVGAPRLARGSETMASQALRGVDGAGAPGSSGMVGECRWGDYTIREVPCRIAALPIFGPFREPGVALGVLGVSELARMGTLELDTSRRVLRWLR